MLPYAVPSGVEVAEVGGSQSGSCGSSCCESDSAIRAQARKLTSQLPEVLDIAQVLAVSRALLQGLTSTQIIEEILDCKGRKFAEGKVFFDNIKAFIEEHS